MVVRVLSREVHNHNLKNRKKGNISMRKKGKIMMEIYKLNFKIKYSKREALLAQSC